MTNIIERVSRAIAAEIHGASYADDKWQDYPDVARAVLQAIREPSEAMRYRGIMEHNRSAKACEPEPTSQAWRAMVDAALGEG